MEQDEYRSELARLEVEMEALSVPAGTKRDLHSIKLNIERMRLLGAIAVSRESALAEVNKLRSEAEARLEGWVSDGVSRSAADITEAASSALMMTELETITMVEEGRRLEAELVALASPRFGALHDEGTLPSRVSDAMLAFCDDDSDEGRALRAALRA